MWPHQLFNLIPFMQMKRDKMKMQSHITTAGMTLFQLFSFVTVDLMVICEGSAWGF